MRKFGFSGSKSRVTEAQLSSLRELLELCGATEFHHGDCVGADEAAAKVAAELGVPLVVHPPEDAKLRAWTTNWQHVAMEVREPAPYLVRNRDIVNETAVLIAMPDGPEKLRSGTWSTVRYSARVGKSIIVIKPDGVLEARLTDADKGTTIEEYVNSLVGSPGLVT